MFGDRVAWVVGVEAWLGDREIVGPSTHGLRSVQLMIVHTYHHVEN